MTSATLTKTNGAVRSDPAPPGDRKWLILVFVSLAQLMVVLDVTIVNIALPRAQDALHFANSDRQWIITAYSLTFGGLLLLGGRLGDLFGRKGAITIGLIGFAGASAIGGAAPDFAVLAGARALQGVFGAILAPAALGTLTTTFQDPAERGKAFAVFGAVAGGGSAVGLLLGGVLTQYLSWRYCLFVNLAFAAVALGGITVLVRNVRPPTRPRLDLVGTLLACLGLFGIVYGFSHAETSGWANPLTLACLGAGAGLLVIFVLVEGRVAHPLLPLRVITQRSRGGALISVFAASIAIFAAFLFVTFYLQTTAGFSPIKTGLAFLPMTAGILTASTISNVVLLNRIGPKPLITSGLVLAGLALLGFTQLHVGNGYAGHILPEFVVLGLGFGLIIAPALNAATTGVAMADAGVASASANTMQQVGGSVGTALLSTVAADATARYHGGHGVAATLHGYHVAFFVAACIFAGGAILCGLLLQSRKSIRAMAPAPVVVEEPVADAPAPTPPAATNGTSGNGNGNGSTGNGSAPPVTTPAPTPVPAVVEVIPSVAPSPAPAAPAADAPAPAAEADDDATELSVTLSFKWTSPRSRRR